MMDLRRSEAYPLRRRAVVSRLLDERGDMLVVAGLGASAWDVTAAGDDPLRSPGRVPFAVTRPPPVFRFGGAIGLRA